MLFLASIYLEASLTFQASSCFDRSEPFELYSSNDASTTGARFYTDWEARRMRTEHCHLEGLNIT